MAHQIRTQSAKPFLRYRSAVCTCARAEIRGGSNKTPRGESLIALVSLPIPENHKLNGFQPLYFGAALFSFCYFFQTFFCQCSSQGCNLLRSWFRFPPFCSQPVAALAGCQHRPERWRTEVLDLCTGSHNSSSFTRRKSRTSNNPVPVLRIPSKYGCMSCSLNESSLTRLRHKLQLWF